MTAAQSLCVHACSDIFVSVQDIERIKTGNIYISIGLRHHAYNVNNIWTVNSAECRYIYIYVFIYIISVSLHAFFVVKQ